MKWPAVTTIHDATCGCCAPAELWMAGEQFFGGRCRRCGLILMIEPAVFDELVRQVRVGLGRKPSGCRLRDLRRALSIFFRSFP